MTTVRVDPLHGSAYVPALAWESWEPKDGVYDEKTQTFNNVTFEDVERLARIVAYKVARNLSNGFRMDPFADPLLYVDCGDYPCLRSTEDD